MITLRQARMQRGLSQRALARMVGISYSFMCHIERGIGNPSPKTASKISQALSMPETNIKFDLRKQ